MLLVAVLRYHASEGVWPPVQTDPGLTGHCWWQHTCRCCYFPASKSSGGAPDANCHPPVGAQGFQLGRTKVFLRAGQMAQLDKLRTELMGTSATTIQRHVRGLLRRRQYQRVRRATVRLQARAETLESRVIRSYHDMRLQSHPHRNVVEPVYSPHLATFVIGLARLCCSCMRLRRGRGEC